MVKNDKLSSHSDILHEFSICPTSNFQPHLRFLVLGLMVETLELLDTFVCCDRFPSGDLAGGSFQLTLAIVSLLG